MLILLYCWYMVKVKGVDSEPLDFNSFKFYFIMTIFLFDVVFLFSVPINFLD